jgi:hypothetical protein
MGAFHRLEAEDIRVTIVTRQRGEWLTEASFIVERHPVGSPNTPPA